MTAETDVLGRFWRRLERLRVEEMLARSARPLDGAGHAGAVARALEEADRHGVGEQIRSAAADVDDWVIRMFNRSTVQPGWMEANWGRPGTIEDRANLAASLGEAVTAILLGSRIGEQDRDELLGAWADLAEEA